MKPIKAMSRGELAAFVQTHLLEDGVNVVLSGGAIVSIYSGDKYVTHDLDLVILGFARRSIIKQAMGEIGFHEVGRHFEHPDTPLFVEFPPGPPLVGAEPVQRIDELQFETGVLRVLSPTDCVKDRLSAYYHWGDRQCLEQAVLVAKKHKIDIREIRRWSAAEGKLKEFEEVSHRLAPRQS